MRDGQAGLGHPPWRGGGGVGVEGVSRDLRPEAGCLRVHGLICLFVLCYPPPDKHETNYALLNKHVRSMVAWGRVRVLGS